MLSKIKHDCLHCAIERLHVRYAIFSQGYSLYFFVIFVHLWWFGGWGFGVGFFDCVFLSFQFIGLGACGVGLSRFFGVGTLFINIEEKSGKKLCLRYCRGDAPVC